MMTAIPGNGSKPAKSSSPFFSQPVNHRLPYPNKNRPNMGSGGCFQPSAAYCPAR
ncbi:hypothetical protein V6667_06080 [Neisseria leonii]|uniref:Uncharacterized protein n=1 Tax=Neisseria leonii TaxID=2995413 RepID=A0A9X4IAV7_9NEIS|nr:hypothetical protein [Neisseria sp. 51.81]MDD9327774.1 hypothetical protein [Neisseria sp. 51.81]